MTSSTTTIPSSEIILDGANLASYLQDRLRYSSTLLTDALAKGRNHVAVNLARKLADDTQVLANLQGALDYAMDCSTRLTASMSATAKGLPSRVTMRAQERAEALVTLQETIVLAQGHFQAGRFTRQAVRG